MPFGNVLPSWEIALQAIERCIEDGDCSYCEAIDRLDAIENIPHGVKLHMNNVWCKAGCPKNRQGDC